MDVHRTVEGQGWGAVDHLVIVHCYSILASATVRELIAYSARHRGPARLAVIYLLEGAAMGVPDETCRADVMELSKHGERCYSSASVVVPPGFTAAMARAFVGGVRMAMRAKLPFDLSASPEAALAWTRTHAAPGSTIPTDERYQRAVTSLRTQNAAR